MAQFSMLYTHIISLTKMILESSQLMNIQDVYMK